MRSAGVIAAVLAFAQGSIAFADPPPRTSLLDGLLANAAKLSANLSDAAVNLGGVNGATTITTRTNQARLAEVIKTLSSANRGFATVSKARPKVFSQYLSPSLLDVLRPSTLSVGNISTTALGSLQSGNLFGTVSSAGTTSAVATSIMQVGGLSTLTVQQNGSIANPLNFQNLSVNGGQVNASVTLTLNDVNTRVGSVGSTAIGALGSGSANVAVTGQLGVPSNVAASLLNVQDRNR